MKIWAGISILLIHCASAKVGQIEEYAALPYQSFVKSIYGENPLSTPDKLEFLSVKITSKQPDVNPEDILIWIEDGKYHYWLELAQDGTVEIPVLEQFMTNRAVLRSNQPKGTMNVEIKQEGAYSLKIGKNGQIPYADLMLSVVEFNKKVRYVEETAGEHATKRAAGYFFKLKNPNEEATVIVQHKGGDIKLKSNSEGLILVPFDAEIYEENPLVILPQAKGQLGHYYSDAK